VCDYVADSTWTIGGLPFRFYPSALHHVARYALNSPAAPCDVFVRRRACPQRSKPPAMQTVHVRVGHLDPSSQDERDPAHRGHTECRRSGRCRPNRPVPAIADHPLSLVRKYDARHLKRPGARSLARSSWLAKAKPTSSAKV